MPSGVVRPDRLWISKQLRVAPAFHHPVHAGDAHVPVLGAVDPARHLLDRGVERQAADPHPEHVDPRRTVRRWWAVMVRCGHAAGHLLLDPSIGGAEPVAEGRRRFPSEDLTQQRIVGVASPHSLRTRYVLRADVPLAGHLDDEVCQLVDGHHLVGAEVERLGVVGLHDAVDALDAVVDVAERPRLLPVAPDLDAAAVLGERHLAAERRRSLLPAAVVRAERPVDVVEPDGAGLHRVLVGVVGAQQLGEQLLPPVGVLGLGRVGVALLQRHHVGLGLPVLGIDAGRGAVEVPLHAVDPGGVERVQVDERVVVQDLSVVRGDEPHASHVCSERVHLVHPARCL